MEMKTIKMEMFAAQTQLWAKRGARGEKEEPKSFHNNFRFQR